MKYTLASLLLTAISVQGATTLTVIMQNTFFGQTNPFLDESGTELMTGDLVQLGYFETLGAPTSNGDPFDSFVAIESITFAIGASGQFSDTVTLDDVADLPGTNSQTLQFGLRIFNAATEAAATRLNTVTDPQWQFTFWDGNGVKPQDSEMLLDPISGIDNPVWQDSANGFRTSLPVVPIPEPGTSLLALLGLGLFAGSRRRK